MKGLQKVYQFLGLFNSPTQTKPFFKVSSVWVLFALYLVLTIVYKLTGFALFFINGLSPFFLENKWRMIRLSILLTFDGFTLLLASYALFLIFTSYYKFVKCCLVILVIWLLAALFDNLTLNVPHYLYEHDFTAGWTFEGMEYPVLMSVLFTIYCKYHLKVKAAVKRFWVRKFAGRISVKSTRINTLSQDKLTGVRGWLLVMAIHLTIMFVYNTYAFFSACFDLAERKPVTPTLLFSQNVMTFFSYMVSLMHLLTALVAAITLMALCMKKSAFKMWYYSFIGSSFLFPVTLAAICFWYQLQIASPMPAAMLAVLFAYPVALAFLALPYIAHSKRVRLTLIN
ncbi:hypothetical protein EHJ06_12395 [Cronobacter malonaticus]|uniref:hypothetical protein n=1 Tax=Cronobacter malonaticus TaxID=413503 RepID=UPI000CFD0384|nr:hypothetical protein [Cronobacter malonaticus]NCH02164.1 hypothetical protein [Cronobacter malonaticus]NCH51922.1 hypothetical protein [Cronobacter malonaticus]